MSGQKKPRKPRPPADHVAVAPRCGAETSSGSCPMDTDWSVECSHGCCRFTACDLHFTSAVLAARRTCKAIHRTVYFTIAEVKS